MSVRNWRQNGEVLVNLLARHLPAYKNLITSQRQHQEVEGRTAVRRADALRTEGP